MTRPIFFQQQRHWQGPEHRLGAKRRLPAGNWAPSRQVRAAPIEPRVRPPQGRGQEKCHLRQPLPSQGRLRAGRGSWVCRCTVLRSADRPRSFHGLLHAPACLYNIIVGRLLASRSCHPRRCNGTVPGGRCRRRRIPPAPLGPHFPHKPKRRLQGPRKRCCCWVLGTFHQILNDPPWRPAPEARPRARAGLAEMGAKVDPRAERDGRPLPLILRGLCDCGGDPAQWLAMR